MNKVFKKVAATGLILSFFVGQVYAEMIDVVEKSFKVDKNSSFSLNNINGFVNISSWPENTILITATIYTENQGDRDKITIEMKQSGSKLSVETHYKKNSNWKNNNSGKVEYEVQLPASINLSDISVVNGALTIKDVQGEVNADVVNGAIVVTGATKNSEINSVNGSIKVTYQELDSSTDKIELNVVNGSIKLYLPENVSAILDIETVHGAIKTDFGLKAKKNMFVGRNLQGNIGSGDVKINLESVNGSIKVLKK